MLSADSKELGRSVSASVWLHPCHLLVLGERQNVAALILCYCGSRAMDSDTGVCIHTGLSGEECLERYKWFLVQGVIEVPGVVLHSII